MKNLRAVGCQPAADPYGVAGRVLPWAVFGYTRIEMDMHGRSVGPTLIPSVRIASRITELGKQISSDYADSALVMIAVLRGSFVFAADLMRQLEPRIDVQLDFVSAHSYGSETVSSGHVTIDLEPTAQLADKHVLVVEDIVDTGRTLKVIEQTIAGHGPATIRTVSLLLKEGRMTENRTLDYFGFRIPDVFVVGYGLDYDQRYRHLPDIRVLDHSARPSGQTR